jgi:hypothetical protein
MAVIMNCESMEQYSESSFEYFHDDQIVGYQTTVVMREYSA